VIIIDASVAAKWIFTEEYSGQARARLRSSLSAAKRITAPPLLPIEVTNIIRQRMRQEALSLPEAQERLGRCYEDRGFDFDYAAKLFDGDFIEWEDLRHAWGEPRVVSVGEVEGGILTVVWTPRGSVRRIISARPASRSEREQLYGYRQTQHYRDS
jgi:uncharacterized protein